MSVPEGEAYDNLLRDLTNVRAKTQKFWMKPNFSGKHPVDKRCCGNYGVQQHRAVRTGTPLLKTIQSWQQYGIQGASTLSSITSQLAKGGDMAKTLDMKGREAAVELIEVCKIFSLDRNLDWPLAEYGRWFQEDGGLWSIISDRLYRGHFWFNPLHYQRKTPFLFKLLRALSLESEQCSVQQRPGRHSNHWSGRCRQSPLWHRHPRGEESSLKDEDEPNENLSWKWIFRETLIFLKTHKWLLRQML